MIIKPPKGVLLNREQPLSRGLVGCWLMNEGAGTQVNDLSNQQNVGSVTNAIWVAGRSGHCLFFDGSGDTVLISTTPSLRITGEVTVSAWILLSTTPADYMLVAGRMTGSSASNKAYYILLSTTGVLFPINESYFASSNGVPALNQWHHLVGTYVPSTSIRLYRNGVLSATQGTGVPAAINNPAGSNSIGSAGYGTPVVWPFNGYIDNVTIYNRALSASEVAQLYRDPYALFRRERIELWTGAKIGSISETVNPSTLVINLSRKAPIYAYDCALTMAAMALQAQVNSPLQAYDYGFNIASTLTLAAALKNSTTAYGSTLTPSILSLSSGIKTPSTTYDFQIAVGAALGLQTAINAITVNSGTLITPSTLDLATSLQNSNALYDFVQSVQALGLQLTGGVPSTAFDFSVSLAEALSLVTTIGDPSVQTGIFITIEPSTLALAVAVNVPNLTLDYLFEIAASLGLSCEILSPTAVVPTGRTYITCPSAGVLDIYIGGSLIARFT